MFELIRSRIGLMCAPQFVQLLESICGAWQPAAQWSLMKARPGVESFLEWPPVATSGSTLFRELSSGADGCQWVSTNTLGHCYQLYHHYHVDG